MRIKTFESFQIPNDDEIDYIEIYRNFELNDQKWFMELSDGSLVMCGYGLVDGQFNGDTWFNICKSLPGEELKAIDGYYTFDATTDIIDPITGSNISHLGDLDLRIHPEDDGFVLVPKDSVVRLVHGLF